MSNTRDIVQKLWNLCHILRDDGVTYHQYVTELTYLLFLKMMKETGSEAQIPKGYRWDTLAKLEGRRADGHLQAASARPRLEGIRTRPGDLRQRHDLYSQAH